MTLYEIENAILNCVDEETGEIIDEERLEKLCLERDVKIENVAMWYKSLTADAKAIKEEEQNLANRRRVLENKAESLKKYLASALDGQKFTTARVDIGWRKSESVQVDDITIVPEEFLKLAAPTVDKTAVKKLLKSGAEVKGCCLTVSNNIQVK